MKKFWQSLLLVMTILVGGLFNQQLAHAVSVGYTVQVVKPQNQDDPLVNYFALRVKPNQRQTLTVVVRNQTAKTQTFKVHLTQAITNSNGIIDYNDFKPQLDPSLKVKIADIFDKTYQTVTVPANGSRRVKLTYQMPSAKLRGCVLGGVYVQQAKLPKAQKTGKLMIRDAFAYAISIRLRESAQNVAPNLRLHQVGVTQVNRRNYVTANLQNFEPGVLSNLSIQASVKAQNGFRTLLKQQQTNLGMAPNSNFNFAIPWNNVNLRAGKYTLHLTAKAGKKNWTFTKNFTITPQELRKLGPTVQNPTKPNYWLYILLAVIIALLLALIGYLLYRNRRNKASK